MRPGFRGDVQGLRAVAVGLVIAAHLATYQLAHTHHLAGGFIGVDVFFVLSGYLITQLLLREVDATGRVSLLDFYSRRARRILPAATLVLLAVLVLSAIRVPAARMHGTVSDSWWSALFFANWHFAHVGTSYFDTTSLSPLQHYWSLSVEEQFYLVWPLLMLLLAPRVSRRTLLLIVGGVALVSLGWSVHTTLYAGPGARSAAYFSTPARAYELAIGAFLAVAPVPVLRRWVRLALGLAGVAALAWATVGLPAGAAFPGWEALVPTVATAALIVAGRGSPTILTRALSVRPLRYLGDISYSLYLWHFPLIVLAPFYLPVAWSTRDRVGVELALMLGLSVASYHLVEQPFQQRRIRLLSRGRRALALWPVALAIVLAGTTGAAAYATHQQRHRDQASAAWWAAHHPTGPTGPTTSPGPGRSRQSSPPVPDIQAELRQAVQLAEQGAPFPPGLAVDRLANDSWQTVFHCYASEYGARPPHDPTSPACTLGDRSSPRTVAVVGDSHAGMWLPALGRIAAAEHLRLVPYIKISCSPYAVHQASVLTPDSACDDYRAWALAQLRRLKPDAILVAARGELYMAPNGTQSVDDQWRAGMTQVLSAFRRITPHLIVFGDVLGRGSEPQDCLTQPGNTEADCLLPPYSVETHSNVITAQVAAQLGATFVRVLPLVCTPHECPLVVGSTVLYRDDSHLTRTWVLHVAPRLQQILHRPLADLAS